MPEATYLENLILACIGASAIFAMFGIGAAIDWLLGHSASYRAFVRRITESR